MQIWVRADLSVRLSLQLELKKKYPTTLHNDFARIVLLHLKNGNNIDLFLCPQPYWNKRESNKMSKVNDLFT